MQSTGGPTIYDVAKAAEVAPSTVSRALSNPGRVSFETAERIRRVAADLGYRSRPMQRELDRRDGLLLLVVADITNPAFNGLIRGAQQSAQDAGYVLSMIDTQDSGTQEERLLTKMVERVDGIVLGGSRMPDSAIRRFAKQRPLIVVNRMVGQVRSLVSDDVRGMKRAAEHLGRFGHREIAYLGGPESSWADSVRWRGLLEAGIELDLRTTRVGPFPPTLAGGAEAFERWRTAPTTAVVAYNDLIAMGFIEAARRHGVDVPGFVSVIGFDNTLNSLQMVPALTTIAAPVFSLGVAAINQLLVHREGKRQATVVLPTRLIIRESTGPARRP